MLARAYVLEILRQHKAKHHVMGAQSPHIRTREQAVAARAQREVPDTFVRNPRLE
jgi:hypothetical protein